MDARGNAYVGNVGFDFPGGEFAPGVLALATPDGSARQVADGVAFPNGLAVLPDGATLIVAESYGNRLTAFDIAADGGLSNRRVWADLPGGYPDGICADAEDAVWYADVPEPALRARARGRRDPPDGPGGPRLLRVRARRPRSPDAADRRGRVGRRAVRRAADRRRAGGRRARRRRRPAVAWIHGAEAPRESVDPGFIGVAGFEPANLCVPNAAL